MALTFVTLREVKASRGKVISEMDLEVLLDRSDLMGEKTHNSAAFRRSYKNILLWETTFLAAK